jgi:hypothetical protein
MLQLRVAVNSDAVCPYWGRMFAGAVAGLTVVLPIPCNTARLILLLDVPVVRPPTSTDLEMPTSLEFCWLRRVEIIPRFPWYCRGAIPECISLKRNGTMISMSSFKRFRGQNQWYATYIATFCIGKVMYSRREQRRHPGC